MKTKALTLLIGLVGSFSLIAQDTLQGGSILIFKDYEPTISDAKKYKNSPNISDTVDIKMGEMKYNVLPKSVETNFKPNPLKAAKLKGEPLDKLYNGLAKFGVGLYATTYGTVQINNLRSRKATFGLNYHHHASNGRVPDASYSGFNDNQLELHGKRFFYNKILSGSVFYDRNVLHRYGFNPDTVDNATISNDLGREKTIQRYQNYGASARFKSFYKDSSKINFDAGLTLRQTEGTYGSREKSALADFSLDWWAQKNTFFLKPKITMDYNTYDPELFRRLDIDNPYKDNIILGELLHGSGSGKNWELTVGLNAYQNIDTVTGFQFYPEVFARYNVVGNLLIPYAGATGQIRRNSFNSLRLSNGFISSNIALVNSKELRVFGGIRGQFSRNTSFNVRAEHLWVSDMPMFVNDYSKSFLGQVIGNEFQMIYDTAKVFNLSAEFSLEEIGRMSFYFKADYFTYRLNNEHKAWHMPDYKVTLSAVYDLRDKLVFRGDLFVISERFARSPLPWEGEYVGSNYYGIKLPMLLDLNLTAEYRYSKRLGAFISFYNIANSKYNLYNDYRMQGITILGGVSFSFLSKSFVN